MSTERLAYLKALFHSGDNNPAYSLGKSLNQLTQPQDKILVLNSELMEFYDVFLNYYADRKTGAANNLASVKLSDFDYIVIPQSHDYVSQEDKLFLYSHFPHRLVPNGTLFRQKQI